MKIPRPLTVRQIKAHLRLGEINAIELDRSMRWKIPRERPPGLLEAIADVRLANAAAKKTRRRK